MRLIDIGFPMTNDAVRLPLFYEGKIIMLINEIDISNFTDDQEVIAAFDEGDIHELDGMATFDPTATDVLREVCLSLSGERFAVWHEDASMFVEEIQHAAISAGLNHLEFQGRGLFNGPLLTSDPSAIEKYKSILPNWLWVILDRQTGAITKHPNS